MHAHDDNALIAAYRAGDVVALDELIKRHLKSVYTFVYRIAGNKQDAEDVVQETFFKMWKHFDSYRKDGNFRAWIFQIAYRTAIDMLRKRRSLVFTDIGNEENIFEDSIEDVAPWPDELVARAQDRALLTSAISLLPLSYREVLNLRYHEHMTFDEIGRVLERPLDTVKSQHRRGLLALRKTLESKGKTAPKS
jgi:RNA polymerase sigma-70 factor (ECF subfamily)